MIPTDRERADGALTDENRATALRRLREAGYVVFESLLPGPLTRELRDAFQVIHEQELQDREADASWNRRGGRGARFEHPFMDPGLLASQFDALEPPREGVEVDVRPTPIEITATIMDLLRADGSIRGGA